MMENTNQNVQNLDEAIIRDMAQNIEKVDDADDFYYEDPMQEQDSSSEMIYSTNPTMESTTEVPSMADFFANVEVPEITASPIEENVLESTEEIVMPDITPEITLTNDSVESEGESFPEVRDFQLTDEELEKVSEVSASIKDTDISNFDVLFDSLYSDVTGANNFISNLIEQKKTVNINEANLIEMQEKLEKEKEEFSKFVETQKEAIELEKEQCKEYVRTQKARIANEEAQFNSDVESTRAELALAEQTLKIGNEKLVDEKQQFSAYKELEEEKLRSDKQKLDSERSSFEKERSIIEEKMKSERLKLESEKEQFIKEKSINDEKLLADRQTLENEKEQFEKEKALELEKIKNAQSDLRKQEQQFAKFKELEEKKLELESKNLSQSCTRFKELVSQFNSGFQQLPGDKE